MAFGVGKVSILLGSGDGSFAAHQTYDAPGAAIDVDVADIDGDGVPDLLVSGFEWVSGPYQHYIARFLGNGDGTFSSYQAFAADRNPFSLAAGDFDGGGDIDVAVAKQFSVDRGVQIYLGDGDGQFVLGQKYDVGDHLEVSTPQSIRLADLDGSGDLDIVVGLEQGGGSSVGGASVLMSNGDGTFKQQDLYEFDVDAFSLQVADMNQSGEYDVVLAESTQVHSTFAVMRGYGDGTFAPVETFLPDQFQWNSRAIAVGDLNGSGVLDVVVVDNTTHSVHVYINLTNPCIADWNNDGEVDINDYYAFLDDFGAESPCADLNGDGEVDSLDHMLFLSAFEDGCD